MLHESAVLDLQPGSGGPGLMAQLLPVAVVSRETTLDLPPTRRYGIEDVAVATAVDARRREFHTARTCARLALNELGVADVAIPREPSGNPSWPPHVAGSLTHCAGYRAAAVGWRRQHRSIGIDAEPSERLPDDVLTLVAGPLEQARLDWLLADDPTVPWDRLLFSAKESVYKACFPLTGQWLNFADVEVIIDPVGAFSARVHGGESIRSAQLDHLTGHWGVAAGIVATAVVVPPRRPAPP
jgi:4'-phosphopantetheinyl transferase EntD